MCQQVGQGRGPDAVDDRKDGSGDENLVIFQAAARQTMVKCLEGHDTQNSVELFRSQRGGGQLAPGLSRASGDATLEPG